MPSLEVSCLSTSLDSDVLSKSSVAFHCYAGKFTNQAAFTSKFPDKEVYFTGRGPSWLVFFTKLMHIQNALAHLDPISGPILR
jgi:hypothetical protein